MKFAKVMFLQVSVCPHGGDMHGCWGGGGLRGHAWLLPGGVHGCSGGACMVAPGGHAWLLWGGTCVVAPGEGMCGCSWGACVVALGGMHGCSRGGAWLLPEGHAWLLLGGHAWDTTRYGDTINERAVRILLECILVVVYKIRNIWGLTSAEGNVVRPVAVFIAGDTGRTHDTVAGYTRYDTCWAVQVSTVAFYHAEVRVLQTCTSDYWKYH